MILCPNLCYLSLSPERSFPLVNIRLCHLGAYVLAPQISEDICNIIIYCIVVPIPNCIFYIDSACMLHYTVVGSWITNDCLPLVGLLVVLGFLFCVARWLLVHYKLTTSPPKITAVQYLNERYTLGTTIHISHPFRVYKCLWAWYNNILVKGKHRLLSLPSPLSPHPSPLPQHAVVGILLKDGPPTDDSTSWSSDWNTCSCGVHVCTHWYII